MFEILIILLVISVACLVGVIVKHEAGPPTPPDEQLRKDLEDGGFL